ncbi:MAG: energy-coupled thiamine transporter ThiT [Clostridia bacterium]|nr:energy-coupled thiamine transporter ThiT [Clostridia bacterium]
MRNGNVRKLVESAVMIALAFVLSLVRIWRMPLGGSVTLLSMLPILLIAVKNGPAWGFGTAFCYSLTQLATSGVFGWGLTPVMLVGSMLLDYILAYTVLGSIALFKKSTAGILFGTVVACALRFVIHFLSGVILWTNFEEFVVFGKTWVGRPALYSICYNGAFMLPELLFTVFGMAIFVTVKPIRKLIGLTNG